jgi:cytochrome o ubiquinol oxidase subunit 1
MAGYNYWFPKVTGFKLNEKWGKLSFWGWAVGFMVAFYPLYILGFMGMPRRISHYDNPEWQPYLIVAAIGTLIIGFGIFATLVQLFLSIKNRKKNVDTTGDPWNARTLEWATASPTQEYNFAIIPQVKDLDDFMRMKEDGTAFKQPEKYFDIMMPKNKPYGPLVGALSVAFGFAMIWYIWWLAIVSFIAIIAIVIIMSFDDDMEYIIPAEEVKRQEDLRFEKLAIAMAQSDNK